MNDPVFADTMQACGATSALLSAAEISSLDENGFLVIQPDPAYWAAQGISLDELRTTIDALIESEGWRGGIEGKENSVTAERPLDPGSDRIANLIEKDPKFDAFVAHPKVLAAVHRIIRAPFKCSAVDMRSPRAGGGEQQVHIDWLPRMTADASFDCAFAGFYLDGMTVSNGALRVIPGTHRRLDWPNEYIDVLKRHDDEIRVEVEPGSIVVANAHVWHAGATNESGAARRTVYVDYRHRGIGQLLNQKRYLSAKTVSRLSPAHRYLLAVRPEDPTDETASLGPGDAYRARYGNRYLPIGDEAESGVSEA